MIPFTFATGIENSSPTIANGRIRRDQMAECGHYDHWRTDFALVREIGLRMLRYGVPLFRVWLGPGRYDWEFSDLAFAELRRLGIEPIADLCHFGLPDWLANFQNPEFPALFADYATAFAQRYPWIRMFTPVNEIYVCARSSAYYGWWNEQERSERSFVTAVKHLARANVLAMHAIVKLRPDAIFVQSESTEYFHASTPEALTVAHERNVHRFLSLDLNYGRKLSGELRRFAFDNGLTTDEARFFEENAICAGHCILGTDYYCSNEHLVEPDGSRGRAEELIGYPMVVREYHERYGVPLMYTETNCDDDPLGEATNWLQRQWTMVRALGHFKIPVVGFTWYSLTDQIDWDVELRERRGVVNPRGLFDLERKIRPVGEAYRDLIAVWKGHIGDLHS